MGDYLTKLSPDALSQIKECCLALDDKKAMNIKVLYLGERSSIADVFIIASGNSEPHLKALRNAAERSLEQHNAEILRRDAASESGWLVVDANDILVHLFEEEQRDFYRLEQLWKDADIIDPVSLH